MKLLSNLDQHIENSLSAIKLLYENNYFEQAKYCAYILIDQLAWLVSGSEKNINVYFKAWLGAYFIKYYPEITEEEIWASRNGLVHNNSSISRDIEKRRVARQLWFVDNSALTDDISHEFDLSSNVYFPVNTSRFLNVALCKAVADFRVALEKDIGLIDNEVENKLGKLFKSITCFN